MRRTRITGVCLLALLAAAALGASSAWASFQPEWGICSKLAAGTGGKYRDAACTVKAGHRTVGGELQYRGEYEWTPESEIQAGGRSHELTLEHGASFETESGTKIACKGLRFEGEGSENSMSLGGHGMKTPLWEFAGCEGPNEPPLTEAEYHNEAPGTTGCAQNSTGLTPGVVGDVLEWYDGEFEGAGGWQNQLGYIEGGPASSSPVVGMSSSEELPGESLFDGAICHGEIGTVIIGGEHRGVNNSVVGEVTPVDSMTSTWTLAYRSSAPGVQSPQRLHNKRGHQLEANIQSAWEPVAFNAVFHFTTAEPLELKARL